MTIKEAAAYLKVHPSTAYRMFVRRTLRGFKVAGTWRISLKDLDAWRFAQEKVAR